MRTVLKGLINAVLCALLVVVQCVGHGKDIFAELDHRLSEYCTDQRTMCELTGSLVHIVCEYYGKTGTSCSRFREVPLDESIVNKILHRINTMRIHVAKGEVVGKDQRKLPQAYGMKKVFWDSELAAFAQIMIHQCLTRNSYTCAVTKNFSDPLMAYTFANITSSAAAIIDNIFSTWKATVPVTRDEIFRSPDLKGRDSQFYVKMVMGNVEHVGCSIGLYEHEKPFATEALDNKQFSGHLICYLSHYSRAGTPVYNTTAPVKGTGWTKCGCPPKYRETKVCLCVPSPRIHLTAKQQTTTSTTKNMSLPTTHAHYKNYEKYLTDMHQIYDATERQQEISKIQLLDWKKEQKLESTPPNLKPGMRVRSPVPTCNNGGNCVPKIVMLPIFTIQNAPKNLSRRRASRYYRRSGNTSLVQTAKPIDDFKLSDEKNDKLPTNISLRSKLLQSVRKIRNKEAVHFFSNEQNESDNQITENSQRILESFERILGSSHLNDKTTTKQSNEDYNDHNEQAKKRVSKLLDLLEEKGKKAQLTSREIIDFDARMKRIYKTVLGRRENLQF